jgi:uncharacterized membrane protein
MKKSTDQECPCPWRLALGITMLLLVVAVWFASLYSIARLTSLPMGYCSLVADGVTVAYGIAVVLWVFPRKKKEVVR